jgi:hypothetical protein
MGKPEEIEKPEPVSVSIKSTLIGFACSSSILSIK